MYVWKIQNDRFLALKTWSQHSFTFESFHVGHPVGTPRNPEEPLLTKKSQMFCKNAKIAYLFVRKCPIWKKEA